MHYGCHAGHVQVIEVLLDYGKNTDLEARSEMNRTPLHIAAIKGWLDIVKLLIRSGADVNK